MQPCSVSGEHRALVVDSGVWGLRSLAVLVHSVPERRGVGFV